MYSGALSQSLRIVHMASTVASILTAARTDPLKRRLSPKSRRISPALRLEKSIQSTSACCATTMGQAKAKAEIQPR
jgi:hypothetical protein